MQLDLAGLRQWRATQLARLTDRAAPRYLLAALVAIHLLLLYPPWRFTTPAAGLDASWILVINHAAAAGWQWGRDIAFTYGPLGYIRHPIFDERLLGSVLLWNGFLLVAVVAGVVGSSTQRDPGRRGSVVRRHRTGECNSRRKECVRAVAAACCLAALPFARRASAHHHDIARDRDRRARECVHGDASACDGDLLAHGREPAAASTRAALLPAVRGRGDRNVPDRRAATRFVAFVSSLRLRDHCGLRERDVPSRRRLPDRGLRVRCAHRAVGRDPL